MTRVPPHGGSRLAKWSARLIHHLLLYLGYIKRFLVNCPKNNELSRSTLNYTGNLVCSRVIRQCYGFLAFQDYDVADLLGLVDGE